MFCYVTTLLVYVLYCDVIHILVLYCDGGTCTCFVM
jgi:hypothetical protein